MASPVTAALCAIVATAFWTLLGYAVGRHLLPRGLAAGASPVLGWSIHSAASLPIFVLIGFSQATVLGLDAACVIVSAASFAIRPPWRDKNATPTIPPWAYLAAAALALVPAVAILPKFSAAGVHLADPIFDHSKIAIVDAMARLGLPPVNPVFGETGTPDRLAYYYLWHYGAAEVALALGASGWEADAGLTWFTALASLTLTMGIVVWLGKRAAGAGVVVALAAATSLRVTLGWIVGRSELMPFLQPPNGFAGWLFQSAWVPQHLMSASCVVLATLLIALYAERQRLVLLPVLVLVVTAGFESSTYVGGVTFAIAAVAAAPVLVLRTERARRLGFVTGLALVAVLALALAAPFVVNELATVAGRGDTAPIVIHQFEVFGEMLPSGLRRTLDWPAYWLIELPLEFPACYVAGVMALVVLLRGAGPRPEKTAIAALACVAGAGLVVSWLLLSTVGSNNDLGLRAVLPATLILMAVTAVGIVRVPRNGWLVAAALGGLILSLPDTAWMIRSNVRGTPVPDANVFAQTPELWAAVRRYAAIDARVANDPIFLQDLTPWPVNASWALLADRSSCFAGKELALAFAPLPPARRDAIQAQFVRVFAGQGTPEDVNEMADKYGCDVVVVVPQDNAWNNDPFAASPDYRLADSRAGRWRIYVLTRKRAAR